MARGTENRLGTSVLKLPQNNNCKNGIVKRVESEQGGWGDKLGLSH